MLAAAVPAPAYSEIDYRVEGDLGLITLSRPASLNAFTPQMLGELLDAFDRTDGDDAVRAVVVTGAGRAFCAGADLALGADAFLPTGGPGEAPRDTGGQLVLRILASLKPVVAAVNGPAVGVGATMTLPMDIRVAATGARFAFPFVRRGITPDGCSSWLLPRLVGMSVAQEWLLSGRLVTAREARAAGLLHHLAAPGDVVRVACEAARALTESSSPVALAVTRRMTWRMLDEPSVAEAHRVESISLAERSASEDAAEGVQAFVERRAPRFMTRVSEHAARIRSLLGDA